MIHLLLTVALLASDPKPVVKCESTALVGQFFEISAADSQNVKTYRWKITPAPRSLRKVAADGSVLLIGHHRPQIFAWELTVSSPDGEIDSKEGAFAFVTDQPVAAAPAVRVPAAAMLRPPADEGEEPAEPPAATAEIARQWLDEIEGPHREQEARRIATAFVQEANALAGGLAKLDTFVEDVAILSKGSLTAEAWQRWTPFFEQLGEQFDALQSAGLLESTEDYIDELMALAKLLKQFAAGKT